VFEKIKLVVLTREVTRTSSSRGIKIHLL